MTPEELCEIIAQEEGVKLDFKREYKLTKNPPAGTTRHEWKSFTDGQWNEFIKDIIALTNGNVGSANVSGRIIIGADDNLNRDGTRQLHDMQHLQITAQQIIQKVNNICEPPIPDIQFEQVVLDGNHICVVTVPPTPYVHETNRRMVTTSGNFDNTGRLCHTTETVYSEFTAFIRRNEDCRPASASERRALEIDKKFDIIVLNESIKFELINNLRRLLPKQDNQIQDPRDVCRSVRENIGPNLTGNLEDYVSVEQRFITRLLLVTLQVINAKSHLSTQVVDYAVQSAKYLEYSTDTGRFQRSEFLEKIHELQYRMKRLIDIANKDGIDWIFRDARDRNSNQPIPIQQIYLIYYMTMLYRYEDVINISIALVKYLLGNRNELADLNLNDVSPIQAETEQIERENPTENEVIDWVVNAT